MSIKRIKEQLIADSQIDVFAIVTERWYYRTDKFTPRFTHSISVFPANLTVTRQKNSSCRGFRGETFEEVLKAFTFWADNGYWAGEDHGGIKGDQYETEQESDESVEEEMGHITEPRQ